VRYRTIPIGLSDRALPLLDVIFGAEGAIPYTCLIDSGAGGVRASAPFARAIGVSLPPEPDAPDVIVGGARSQVYRAQQELTIIVDGTRHLWTAEVSFCDPWPHPFGLLGHSGFLDRFDVTLRGRSLEFDVA
jgi:hypothetical protein